MVPRGDVPSIPRPQGLFSFFTFWINVRLIRGFARAGSTAPGMLPPNISEVLRAGLMNRYIHATLNLMALIATRITLEHGQASYSRGIYSLEICILALTRQLSGREFRVVVRTGQVTGWTFQVFHLLFQWKMLYIFHLFLSQRISENFKLFFSNFFTENEGEKLERNFMAFSREYHQYFQFFFTRFLTEKGSENFKIFFTIFCLGIKVRNLK